MTDRQNQVLSAGYYAELHSIVFRDGYAGYRPDVVESPNGDGIKDDKKRFAHVADKYVDRVYNAGGNYMTQDEHAFLRRCLDICHEQAVSIAVELGIPQAFWPNRQDSTLRILEYGPQAESATHADFDLFTLMCYRNIPEYFIYVQDSTTQNPSELAHAQKFNSQIHFGELLEQVCPRIRATKHRVMATNTAGVHQHSIVYFAVPSLSAVLPSGQTVGQWLDERKNRSRY